MANQVTVSNDHSINVTIEPPANVQVLVSRAVIGTIANVPSANTANTVTNNAQPNITSVGTLTSLTSNGNITAPFFIGNVVGNISGNITVPGNNTAVLFNQVGNAGASDALTFNYSSNVLTANGNIIANYFIGNGSQLTGIVTQQSNNANFANLANLANFANVANVANAVAGANVSGIVANANYSAFSGIAAVANSVAVANVSGIGNIATVNLDGNSGNILFGNGTFAAVPNVANVANANFANFAGNVVNSNQPNITSVGTLTGLVVGGNITPNANITYDLGNNTNRFNDLYLAGNTIYLGAQEISANATGITITGNLSGDASGLANIAGANVTGTVANANYSAYSGVAGSANSVAGANVSGAVAFATTANSVAVANVSGIGNIATVNLDGNASNILFGNGVFSTVPNVSNVANANYANFAGTAFSVSGSNVSGAVANAIHATVADSANGVAGANVVGQVANALIAGTVYTNAQPNITSVGTLTSLSVTGDITSFANITGDYFLGNGALLTGVGNFSAALGYHGSFFSNVSQTIASTTTAYPITLNNTSAGTYGVSVASNSRVTFTYAGTYNIQYSVQFTNTDNAIYNATIWLRKNGTDVPDTNSVYAVPARHGSTNGQLIGAINYIQDVNANDYYELIWQAESTTISLEYIPPGTTPTSPASPSAIVTAMQVTNVQAATLSGNLTGNLIGNTFGLSGTSFINIIGNISGNVFTGNGSGLTQLVGGNVTGEVANATYATTSGTADSVAGANVSGEVANATYATTAGTAYSVDVANVVGIGNIATINLDGNVNNLLAGDGTFVPIPTDLANANYANFAGDVVNSSQPNITSVGTLTEVNTSGNINFIGGSNSEISQDHANGATTMTIRGGNGSSLLILDGLANARLDANANVSINANSQGNNQAWTFDNTGNLTLPGNVFGINYANGTQVTIDSVANANYANFAGEAFSVALANVSGAGNIASINLTGSSSNVLYGNGVFAPVAGGGGGSSISNGNSNVNIATSDGDVTVSVAGSSNVLQISNTFLTTALGYSYTVATPNAQAFQVVQGGTGANGLTANLTNRFFQRWNNASATFEAFTVTATDTASNANSRLFNAITNSTSQFSITKSGNVTFAGVITGNAGGLTNIPVGNLSANVNYANTAGQVVDAAQANITSVGALTGLTIDSNTTGLTIANTSNTAGRFIQSQAAGVGTGLTANLYNVFTQKWNNSSVQFTTLVVGATDVTSNANSLLFQATTNSVSQFSINKSGNVTFAGILTGDGGGLSNIAGGGSPGGSNTQIQFNNNGSFGGISTVTWNGSNISLGAVGNVKVTGGVNNEVMRTDGTGNLSFTSIAQTLLVGTRVGPYTVPITNYTFQVTARTGNVTVYVN
jgi:hypothetical protein